MLAIMLLNSLNSEFDNFCCTMTSGDVLLTHAVLYAKTIEECKALSNDSRNKTQEALVARNRR